VKNYNNGSSREKFGIVLAFTPGKKDIIVTQVVKGRISE